MGQYFWYVRDDDSSDRFFKAEDIPEPEPPKKKSGLENKHIVSYFIYLVIITRIFWKFLSSVDTSFLAS